MEPQTFILSFLDKIRRLRFYVCALNGTYILLAYIAVSYLLACLLALSFEPIVEWIFPVIGIFCGGLVYIIFNYFITLLITPFSQDDAALLAESRYPGINNSLINSSQLGRRLKDSQFQNTTSLDFIGELHRRTSIVVNKIDPSTIIDQSRMTIGRNWFLGTLGALALIALFIPEFLTKGYERWTNPKNQTQVSQKKIANRNQTSSKPTAVNYSIESLDLTFNFPSYTGKKPELIKSSDGKIHVLPGTEVNISAKTNGTVSGANMIFNENDNFAMSKENKVYLKASLLVKEKGFYQFSVKDQKGKKHLLATKYPVTLAKDQPPNIVLFLANPKPVYFYTDKVQLFYEGKDDFGINAVELVVSINGKINRIPVKKFKNQEKEAKDSYTWTLAQMLIKPGDKVNYHLEIKDNDNVFGPNKGQSETYSFSIFDSNREMENLIAMQEELKEKMIALLATGLVKGASFKSQPSNLIGWKQLFTISVDELIIIISLAQQIHDRGKTIDQFPQHYLNLLKNITRELARIRQNQIEALSDLQNKIHRPTQAKFEVSSPYSSVNSRMTEHLEKDILFLVKITNEQKLNRMMALEEELNELTQTLREDLENIGNEKSSKISDELKNKIDKIKKTLQKIMEQLARQTQSMPDEFLNPNAFKRLNMEKLSASLKKMQDMISRGRFEEAMEELKQMAEDLKLLANQINRTGSEMESFLDPETMEVLDSGIKKLDQLRNLQRNLVEETTQINQKLRQQQADEFENQLNKFFSDLLRDVDSIRKLFEENEKLLEEHEVMNQLQNLIEKEIKAGKKIKELSQATVDATQSEKLDQHFNNLKEAHRNHSRLLKEKDSLRVNEFQRFKEALPQLLKKYDTLNKLAKLQDLKEFAALFKQVYPNVLRWQNNLRTAPNLQEDLSNKLDRDLTQTTRLNNEISKKLGSMIRAIRKNYKSSITMDQKKELKQIEKQEYQIRKESEKLSQRFDQLSRENPMTPLELSQGMKETGRNMERTETSLREQNIPKSIESGNLALKGLDDTRDLLHKMKNYNRKIGKAQRQTPRKLGTGSSPDSRRGGATRMQKERVLLPTEDQYKAPKEFREEILNAMKKQTPKDYERMVMEYYKVLVK